MTQTREAARAQTDEMLMQGVASGWQPAFDELYHRYAQRMHSYFYRMLWQNPALAEDCTQELFIKIIRYKTRYDSSRSFSTWIYTIACNICKNEYRRQEVKTKLHQGPVTDSTMAHGDKNIDLKQFAGAVRQELAALDEEKQTLFVLRFEEQLTVPEISNIMNIPEGTVKSRIFYLLKHMGSRLKTYQFAHYDS
jgi:RNA polymerase sigma-70 factor (ECF subfamily)